MQQWRSRGERGERGERGGLSGRQFSFSDNFILKIKEKMCYGIKIRRQQANEQIRLILLYPGEILGIRESPDENIETEQNIPNFLKLCGVRKSLSTKI